MFLSKYGVARHIYIPIPKAGSANHAVSGDWTPAAGDVKISKDGGAAANVTNLPTAIAMGNSTVWDFSITTTELQCAQAVITVSDSATKAVDDTGFIIETYGNASAQHAFDLGTASTAQTANNDTKLADIQTRLPAALTANGNMKSSVLEFIATALTETSGQIAAAFKKFFDIASPTSTANRITLVDTTTTNTDMITAAGVRAAVGLATANLDTQLSAIAAYIDTEVAAIKAKTDNLPTDPADASDVAAAIAALNDLSAAEVNAEVVDALATDTYAEPTGVPAATASLAAKINRLHEALRNKFTLTSTDKTFYDDSGNALWKKPLTDDGTTYTEGEGTAP